MLDTEIISSTWYQYGWNWPCGIGLYIKASLSSKHYNFMHKQCRLLHAFIKASAFAGSMKLLCKLSRVVILSLVPHPVLNSLALPQLLSHLLECSPLPGYWLRVIGEHTNLVTLLRDQILWWRGFPQNCFSFLVIVALDHKGCGLLSFIWNLL